MAKSPKSPSKVGDLLVDAGLLDQQELQEGMDLASTLGLPIGKTMVMAGLLKERTVRAAVLVQSMLKDGLIDRELAVQTITMSQTQDRPVEDCLIELGWKPPSDLVVNKVGQLLVEAGVMNQSELDEALNMVDSMGLPLGRVLVLSGKVKGPVVWCALNAQIFLRDNKISRAQAIKAVCSSSEKQTNFEQSLKAQGLDDLIHPRKIKLGELLVLSGLVSQEEILGAVEESIVKEKSLGEILLRLQLLSEQRLEDALKLQEMAEKEEITAVQAVEILRQVKNTSHTLTRVLAESKLTKPEHREKVQLGELLKMTGWITDDEIDEAAGLAVRNSNLLGRMLVAFGFIDETMLYNALRCQFLLREGFIKPEQAVVALNFSQRTRCSLDTALEELPAQQESAIEAGAED